VRRHGTERVAVAQPQIAKLGMAEPGGVRQNGVEHGFQVARGAADDAQNLGGGLLLLERVSELAPDLRRAVRRADRG
jgi:hypothetical protein